MKKGALYTLAGLAIVFVGAAVYLWQNGSFSPKKNDIIPTPTLAPTSTLAPTPTTEAKSPNCTADDLQATIQLEGAAGNISGPIGITNISSGDCTIDESVTVKVLYPNSITNLKVEQGKNMTFTLAPEQGMMNMISFPNGAQCSKPVGTDADFYVEVNGEQVEYAQGNDPQTAIEICEDESEETVIKISGFNIN